MFTLLLESPTEDCAEAAICLFTECDLKLTQMSPRGITVIFEDL